MHVPPPQKKTLYVDIFFWGGNAVLKHVDQLSGETACAASLGNYVKGANTARGHSVGVSWLE